MPDSTSASPGSWMGYPDEFRVMEKWFGTDDPAELVARYTDALAVLDASSDVESWLAHAAAHAGITEKSAHHFREDWLGGPAARRIGADSMVTALRDGLVAALHAARDAVLPMSFVWVARAPEAKGKYDLPPYFEVGHVAGVNSVTVVIMTSSQMQREAPAG